MDFGNQLKEKIQKELNHFRHFRPQEKMQQLKNLLTTFWKLELI